MKLIGNVKERKAVLLATSTSIATIVSPENCNIDFSVKMEPQITQGLLLTIFVENLTTRLF